VDPGYPGHLLITLFNLGQTRVILHRGECFCSLTLFDVAPGARLYKKGPKQLAAPPAKQPRRSLREWLVDHQVSVTVVGICVTFIVIIEQLAIFIWSVKHH
jgi:hypothetical protein